LYNESTLNLNLESVRTEDSGLCFGMKHWYCYTYAIFDLISLLIVLVVQDAVFKTCTCGKAQLVRMLCFVLLAVDPNMFCSMFWPGSGLDV